MLPGFLSDRYLRSVRFSWSYLTCLKCIHRFEMTFRSRGCEAVRAMAKPPHPTHHEVQLWRSLELVEILQSLSPHRQLLFYTGAVILNRFFSLKSTSENFWMLSVHGTKSNAHLCILTYTVLVKILSHPSHNPSIHYFLKFSSSFQGHRENYVTGLFGGPRFINAISSGAGHPRFRGHCSMYKNQVLSRDVTIHSSSDSIGLSIWNSWQYSILVFFFFNKINCSYFITKYVTFLLTSAFCPCFKL